MDEVINLELAQVILLADNFDWDHMDFDNGWWIVMGIGMILFWGLVILGIVWVVREVSGPRRAAQPGGAPDALETLDRRLAEGDITVEEYDERRRALRS
ncbi:MAG: SHOCT domain-containing protein [Solirubrobacterales bacterium]